MRLHHLRICLLLVAFALLCRARSTKDDCYARLLTPHRRDADQRLFHVFVTDRLSAEQLHLCRDVHRGKRVQRHHLGCIPEEGIRAIGNDDTGIEVLRKGFGTRIRMMEAQEVEAGLCSPDGPEDTLAMQARRSHAELDSYDAELVAADEIDGEAEGGLGPARRAVLERFAVHGYIRFREVGKSRWMADPNAPPVPDPAPTAYEEP